MESNFDEGKYALTVTLHPEGSILVGGHDYLAKYSSEGVLDDGFGVGGKTQSTHANPVEAIAVQADGKILVTGYSPTSGFVASRFLADGNFDLSYGNPAWSTGSFPTIRQYSHGLHLRDDGRMLLTGDFVNDPGFGFFRAFIAGRINSFGTLENWFPSNFGSLHSSLSSIQLPDGKILQVGQADGDIAILRRHADGSNDSSFGTGGVTKLPILSGEDRGQRISLQRDGKILVAGSAFNGATWEAVVVRLSHEGAIDETFVAGGSSAVGIDVGPGNDFGYDILALPDGKIFLAGRAGDDIALVRLLGDSDIISPTAMLTSPVGGSTIDIGVLNAQGYLEVTFADEGESGLDTNSLIDVEHELSLSGPGTAGVSLDGSATLVSGTTYRYAFMGTFGIGPVSVEFAAGTFADQLGNVNESALESFTVQPSPSADFDLDTDVDGRDFLMWQRGESSTPFSYGDLLAWQDQYGTSQLSVVSGQLLAEDSPESSGESEEPESSMVPWAVLGLSATRAGGPSYVGVDDEEEFWIPAFAGMTEMAVDRALEELSSSTARLGKTVGINPTAHPVAPFGEMVARRGVKQMRNAEFGLRN